MAPAMIEVTMATSRCMSGRLLGMSPITSAPNSGASTSAVSTGKPVETGGRASISS